VRDGDDEPTLREGGVLYRFAVIVDCGKCFPRGAATTLHFHPELRALCERVLGCGFVEAANFY
jgi:hypothetical protein